MVVILDFGDAGSQVIGRKVRELGIYCEVLPGNTTAAQIKSKRPEALILSGSNSSVYESGAPGLDIDLDGFKIPILGICYGSQLMAALSGGTVAAMPEPENGLIPIRVIHDSPLFRGIERDTDCRMSHSDMITQIPAGFTVTAVTDNCPVAAMEDRSRDLYAVQFHPETGESGCGKEILENFLFEIAGLSADWDINGYVDRTVEELREKIGDKRALCALSGGVDSMVSAMMVHRAVGQQLTCIFVDTGLMRLNEGDSVEAICKSRFGMNFIRINAQERFLQKLAGVTDPEQKRKIIGEEFIRVFEEESQKLGKIEYLVQGTIYPDIIESGVASGVIKSHHNVGGLPEIIDFEEILEPVRMLFKGEVRRAGIHLDIDEEIVWRQPFPGPGLAVRCIGELKKERLDTLRLADAIFREEITNAGFDREIEQYFAVLTDVKSVGAVRDTRTYGYTVALRAIKTTDFMTAEIARLPYELIERCVARITSEVEDINRVVYDVTSKPPGTIEWE